MKMMSGFRLLFLCIGVSFWGTSCRAIFNDYQLQILMVEGLEGKVEIAREGFENIYYELVKKGHFDSSYCKNLIIDSSLSGDVQEEGMILFSLIGWLAKKNDIDSLFLLRKLNKLYFLELHRFIVSRMKLKKQEGRDILALGHDLYHAKASYKGVFMAPFRTSLSKLFLMVSMINDGENGYDSKKEVIALSLDKIKREMLTINSLINPQKISDTDIKNFVTLLQIYSVKKPIIKPGKAKKIILYLMIAAITGIVLYNYVWPHRDSIRKKLSDLSDDLRNYFIKPLGKGVAEGLLAERKKLNEILRGAVTAAIKPLIGEKALTEAEKRGSGVLDNLVKRIGDRFTAGVIGDPGRVEGVVKGAADGLAITLLGERAVREAAENDKGVLDDLGDKIGDKISEALLKNLDKRANGLLSRFDPRGSRIDPRTWFRKPVGV